jgi:hypothetical protein
MSLPTPDEFLSVTPIPVTVNTNGAWKTILDHEEIVLKDTSTLNDGTHPHSGNDVWVNLPQLFNLDFASDRNAAYFTALPGTGDRQNNAWIGDSLGCRSSNPRDSEFSVDIKQRRYCSYALDKRRIH